jgi:hypothetical protein
MTQIRSTTSPLHHAERDVYNGGIGALGRSTVQISVLVDRVEGNGYRARSTAPFAVSAEGSTRAEALAKLRGEIQTLLNGTEVVALDIGHDPHPWLELAGMHKGVPWIEDWKRSVAEYRQKVDEDPDAL